MRLALFDLDHTLVPFDSGMAWTRHLVGVGALQPAAQARYLDFCRRYVAGTLDIHAMHRASWAPLRAFSPAQLGRWRDDFERELEARVPDQMRALVRRHRDGADLCAIVTATARFVAEPFARLFGVEHLVATESVVVDGVPTGEIQGLPCFGEHKLARVQQWLATRPAPAGGLAAFDASWFYSDSSSDLPLLLAVTHPVAVRPDDRLRAHARAAGWPILEAR
jgi:HAD superfamily hydrolase (TIGR01490 family)